LGVVGVVFVGGFDGWVGRGWDAWFVEGWDWFEEDDGAEALGDRSVFHAFAFEEPAAPDLAV
jgi:hypothetical protein